MKTLMTATLTVAMMLMAGNIFAADYRQYSTEELVMMRGTTQDATGEAREAFRNEWQKRLQIMSHEERQNYMGKKSTMAMKSPEGMVNKRG